MMPEETKVPLRVRVEQLDESCADVWDYIIKSAAGEAADADKEMLDRAYADILSRAGWYISYQIRYGWGVPARSYNDCYGCFLMQFVEHINYAIGKTLSQYINATVWRAKEYYNRHESGRTYNRFHAVVSKRAEKAVRELEEHGIKVSTVTISMITGDALKSLKDAEEYNRTVNCAVVSYEDYMTDKSPRAVTSQQDNDGKLAELTNKLHRIAERYGKPEGELCAIAMLRTIDHAVVGDPYEWLSALPEEVLARYGLKRITSAMYNSFRTFVQLYL